MKHKHYLPIVILLFIALVIGQLAANYYFYRRTQNVHDTTIVTLISKAIDNLYKPAPVDPKTGDSYIPQARIQFPAVKDGQDMLYSYLDYDNQTEIHVTSRQLIGQGEAKLWTSYANNAHSQAKATEAVFAAVPNLQACARGVQLYSKEQPKDSGLRSRTSLHLKDDRLFYVYTEDTCKQDLQPLINQVDSARSY